MEDPLSVRRITHPDGFIGVTAEWPLAIDVFPRLDSRHNRQVVIGHLHTDHDEIDVRMLSQLLGIVKRQRYPVMPRRYLCRILPRRAESADLEIRKGLQSWDMGDRRKSAAWVCSDNPHADPSAARHGSLPTSVLALDKLDHDPFRSEIEGKSQAGISRYGS